MDVEKLDELISHDELALRLLHGTKPTRDVAPFEDLNRIATLVSQAVHENRCLVLDPKQPAYTAGNSLVYCGPDIFISHLFDHGEIRVAMTTVVIYGNVKEELHHHTSHVFSYVIEGIGWLQVENGGLMARAGDLVVIPRGVRHLFNCNDGDRMLIFAVEISDQPIDHQKNYYQQK
jgi:quercetin dioxygenase-like cupin family protein